MLADVRIVREHGELLLKIDASGLHKKLDQLGVAFFNNKYTRGPRELYDRCIDTNKNRIAAYPFLYKGPQTYNLRNIWEIPPKLYVLEAIVESSKFVVRDIMFHYYRQINERLFTYKDL